MPTSPSSNHNCIILQISSGQGPAECQRFVPLLAQIIRHEATAAGINCHPLSEIPTKDELRASLRFAVDGAELTQFRRAWEGTVQWIWKSTIRPHWPRKNWFVKVSFYDFQADPDQHFRTTDLRFETCRASGPGGQHVNTTDSAVRLTHLPSGIVCIASEERSQQRNRTLALLRLQERLNLVMEKKRADQNREMWIDHYRLERGSAIRIFKGLPPIEVTSRPGE